MKIWSNFAKEEPNGKTLTMELYQDVHWGYMVFTTCVKQAVHHSMPFNSSNSFALFLLHENKFLVSGIVVLFSIN